MAESIEKLISSGDDPEQLHTPALDLNVGGFLNELGGQSIAPEVIVPTNALSGKPMSPVEARTGVPLPIIGKLYRQPNRHHAYYFGRSYLEGTSGQQAVRHSRMQRVGQYVHTQYHRNFSGTAFSDSVEAEYEMTVLNCAGYVPAYGVKFEQDQPVIAELSPKEKRFLRKEHAFSQENGSSITEFLLNYALEQDFDNEEQLHIEEFIELTPRIVARNEVLRQRKLRLAERLTHKAIGMAVDPINPVYSEARKEGQLRDGTPSSAWEVVRDKVRWKIPQYFPKIEQKIVLQYDM